MKVLCIGGTGTVGREVVGRLRERGVSVRCMTRSAERAGTGGDGVELVRGDLEDPSSLERVFEGVDRVHLLTPLHPDEAQLGIAAVDAARRAGVERIVFHSVHRVEDGAHIPHFGSKLEIQRALETSGVPWVTIEPNSYMQNDLIVREPIMEMQIYPLPIGPVGVNRVDVRDIADATVAALLEDGHEGARYPVAGSRAWTGEEITEAWGDALDGTIVYVGDDLDMWEEGVTGTMPEWLVRDLRIMWAHFLEHGLLASPEELALQTRLLGREPRGFEDFVDETIAAWQTG